MKLKAMLFVLCMFIFMPCGVFAQRPETAQADAELNRVWKQVMKCYKDDKVFIGKMKTAQKAWLKFRDAHIESVFPAADKQMEYGSIYPTCVDYILEELTRERTRQLKKWIEGIPEGDGCSGSIRTPDGLGKCR